MIWFNLILIADYLLSAASFALAGYAQASFALATFVVTSYALDRIALASYALHKETTTTKNTSLGKSLRLRGSYWGN